nr:putative uncharacterized protein [uncultured bacterium]
MTKVERCVGCSAEVPVIEGPTHRYMTAAPACWHRYGELLSMLYGRPGLEAALVMAADTYAVQHPGSPNPQAIQSVGIHLLNLYAYLVRGRPVRIPQKNFTERTFHAIAAPTERASYWLEPPSFAGTLTVFDVPSSGSDEAIQGRVRSWAESVWDAWHAHHSQVAAWYDEYAPS